MTTENINHGAPLSDEPIINLHPEPLPIEAEPDQEEYERWLELQILALKEEMKERSPDIQED